MSLRKLGIVREIVETAGMGISHAYDDLVFLDHNAFLLQFTDENDKLLLHCNRAADKDAIKEAVARLKGTALGVPGGSGDSIHRVLGTVYITL